MKLEEAKKILSDAGYIVEGSMSLEDKILHAKLHIEYDVAAKIHNELSKLCLILNKKLKDDKFDMTPVEKLFHDCKFIFIAKGDYNLYFKVWKDDEGVYVDMSTGERTGHHIKQFDIKQNSTNRLIQNVADKIIDYIFDFYKI